MTAGARWASRFGAAGIAAFVLGPLMAHLAVVPAMAGFVVFGLGGLLGLLALVVGIIGILRGRGATLGLALGLVITLAFLAIAVPSGKLPPINDITTDTMNPPQFVTAPSLPANRGRDMSYPGASFAARQRRGYPTLAPLHVDMPPNEAFQRVQAAARHMPGWEITRTEPAARALEGVATTRLFRFKDDFVIEVRPQDGHSIVQMRSKSRDGKGDIGANAARITAFFAALK
jgi:uncharacterized protein (DUF1499 family)